MISLFHQVSYQCSRLTTRAYSTSFSTAIRLLHQELHTPIYNIYGFVRFADEIVDSFHAFDKAMLLEEFKKETFDAINRRISLNPIINSFQQTVNQFHISHDLIHAFFRSMEQDLTRKTHDSRSFDEYIYGSAEVVGLMCLYVFCEGDQKKYEELEAPARSLGSAFQKVNFLRDMKADFQGLSRIYFPECDFTNFTISEKLKIESDIQHDFDAAYDGIIRLPMKSRLGVYVAYKYYLSLFKKIKKTNPAQMMKVRIRVPNYRKYFILLWAGLQNHIGLIRQA